MFDNRRGVGEVGGKEAQSVASADESDPGIIYFKTKNGGVGSVEGRIITREEYEEHQVRIQQEREEMIKFLEKQRASRRKR